MSLRAFTKLVRLEIVRQLRSPAPLMVTLLTMVSVLGQTNYSSPTWSQLLYSTGVWFTTVYGIIMSIFLTNIFKLDKELHIEELIFTLPVRPHTVLLGRFLATFGVGAVTFLILTGIVSGVDLSSGEIAVQGGLSGFLSSLLLAVSAISFTASWVAYLSARSLSNFSLYALAVLPWVFTTFNTNIDSKLQYFSPFFSMNYFSPIMGLGPFYLATILSKIFAFTLTLLFLISSVSVRGGSPSFLRVSRYLRTGNYIVVVGVAILIMVMVPTPRNLRREGYSMAQTFLASITEQAIPAKVLSRVMVRSNPSIVVLAIPEHVQKLTTVGQSVADICSNFSELVQYERDELVIAEIPFLSTIEIRDRVVGIPEGMVLTMNDLSLSRAVIRAYIVRLWLADVGEASSSIDPRWSDDIRLGMAKFHEWVILASYPEVRIEQEIEAWTGLVKLDLDEVRNRRNRKKNGEEQIAIIEETRQLSKGYQEALENLGAYHNHSLSSIELALNLWVATPVVERREILGKFRAYSLGHSGSMLNRKDFLEYLESSMGLEIEMASWRKYDEF